MTLEDLPNVSPAEMEILRLVWENKEATVQQVVDNLPPDRAITYATVQTLLRRLEQKGYLQHDVRGKAHVFYAAAKREEVISRSVGDFVNRLFGGDPVPLVQYLAEHGDVSEADIERLREIIKNRG